MRFFSIHIFYKLNVFFCLYTENEDASDENSLDEKIDTEPTTATTIQEENVVNTKNVSVEPASTEQVVEEPGIVEYQEAPSASAVPVPTFTPQQPLTASSSGIAALSAPPPPQNLKTLPHGMYMYRQMHLCHAV